MEPICNLIVDSCCDLPRDVVDREGVYLLKFPYFDDAGEHLDDLYHRRSAHEFFQGMRDGSAPHTAQLPIPSIRAAFEWAHAQGKPAVFLLFSSGLSGTYDTVLTVLDQMREEIPDLDVTVVDTRMASIAEGLLVHEALRQRERGLSASELAAWADEARYFVRAQFMVDDLDALRRGGRIPASVAAAGSKLDVKPLLTFDMEGKLAIAGIARGRRKGLKAIASFYAKTRVEDGAIAPTVILGNADCPKDAEKLGDLVRDVSDQTLIMESSIGPVIGSHVGPGMIALVFWGTDVREDLSVADRIANRVKGR